MTFTGIPSRLFRFIELARFEWAVHPDGVVEFGHDLNATSSSFWRVVPRGDGWLDVIDVIERGLGTQWLCAFPSWELAERWFLDVAGFYVRQRMRVPVVEISFRQKDLDPRCQLVADKLGEREVVQVTSGGEVLAVFGGASVGEAVRASQLLLEDPDLIVESYLDRDAKPLYRVFD